MECMVDLLRRQQEKRYNWCTKHKSVCVVHHLKNRHNNTNLHQTNFHLNEEV